MAAVFGIDSPTQLAKNYAGSAAEELREELAGKLSSTGIRVGLAIVIGDAIVGTVRTGRAPEIRILGEVCEKARLAARRESYEAKMLGIRSINTALTGLPGLVDTARDR